MAGGTDLLDRGIPDALSTADLPPVLAAEVDYLAGRSAAWVEPRADTHPFVRARALVQARAHDEARRALRDGLADGLTPQGLVAGTWAASRVGSPEIVAALAAASSSLVEDFVHQEEVPLAPREQVVGLLAAARGDLGAATELLALAAEVGDRRAPFWGALARLELARVLRSAEVTPLPEGLAGPTARGALVSARAFFAAGGYRHLGRVAAAVEQPPELVAAAEPTLGHLVEGRTWTVGFGVQPPVQVRPSKGIVALRHLVSSPGRRVPALAIDRLLEGGDPTAELEVTPDLLDERARTRVSKLLRRTIERLSTSHQQLGAHLAKTVHTGFACRYEADSRIVWRT